MEAVTLALALAASLDLTKPEISPLPPSQFEERSFDALQERKEEVIDKVSEVRQNLSEGLAAQDLQELDDIEAQANKAVTSDFLDYLLERVEKIEDRASAAIDAAAAQEAQDALRAEQGLAIANATYDVPSPGSGLCAKWVSQVFQSAGFGYPSGNACDYYWRYCDSADESDIQEGMVIAVDSEPGTRLSVIYGHVGILVWEQNQWMVRQNLGGTICEVTLQEWIDEFGVTSEVRWGWVL